MRAGFACPGQRGASLSVPPAVPAGGYVWEYSMAGERQELEMQEGGTTGAAKARKGWGTRYTALRAVTGNLLLASTPCRTSWQRCAMFLVAPCLPPHCFCQAASRPASFCSNSLPPLCRRPQLYALDVPDGEQDSEAVPLARMEPLPLSTYPHTCSVRVAYFEQVRGRLLCADIRPAVVRIDCLMLARSRPHTLAVASCQSVASAPQLEPCDPFGRSRWVPREWSALAARAAACWGVAASTASSRWRPATSRCSAQVRPCPGPSAETCSATCSIGWPRLFSICILQQQQQPRTRIRRHATPAACLPLCASCLQAPSRRGPPAPT